MDKANDSQVGGDHYQVPYQHWDFVCDTGLHYLLGNATKYASRWRNKGGLEDLYKCLHYVNKAKERGITSLILKPYGFNKNLDKFGSQFHIEDKDLIVFISYCRYSKAISSLNDMISSIESGPTLAYVNPDKPFFRG